MGSAWWCPCRQVRLRQEDQQQLPGRSGGIVWLESDMRKRESLDGRGGVCCRVLLSLGPRPGCRAQLSAPPSLTLHPSPCSQVFLWAPWTWYWTPAPAWPPIESCTRPRTHRSTGQWRAVGELDRGVLGRACPERGRKGGDTAGFLGWVLPPGAQHCPSLRQHSPGQCPA